MLRLGNFKGEAVCGSAAYVWCGDRDREAGRRSSAVLSGVRVNEVVPELKTDMGSLLDVSNLGEKQTVGLLLDGETYEISMDCRGETKLLPVNVKVTETAKICFSNYELASILEEDGRTCRMALWNRQCSSYG